jgi:hypothetical protein
MQKAQHKMCCANAWRRRWTARCAYLLRQVLRLARKDACGIVSPTSVIFNAAEVSQSTLCARTEKAPTEREVRLGLFLADPPNSYTMHHF